MANKNFANLIGLLTVLGVFICGAPASANPNSDWTTPLATKRLVNQWSDYYLCSTGDCNGCPYNGGSHCLSHNKFQSWGAMNAKAIDISTVSGTYVYADQSGYATCTTDSVRIHHSDGTYSIFAHVVPVICNTSVSINTHIANTNSSAGHVHWANCDSNCLSSSATGGTYANDLRPVYGVPPNSTCSWPYGSSGLNPGHCYVWPVCTPAQNGYSAEQKLVGTSSCASGYAWYVCKENSSSYGSGWYWSACLKVVPL